MEPELVGLTAIVMAAVIWGSPVPGLKLTAPRLGHLLAENSVVHDEALYYFTMAGQGMIPLSFRQEEP